MSRHITESDYQAAAERLGAPVAAIKAVTAVESAGSGFMEDGRVKVQYEPHIMNRRLKAKFGNERAAQERAKYPDLVRAGAGSYQSLDKEDKDMGRAADLIDRDCALESASWGSFQIMGYHWQHLGYSSLQDFVNAMYTASGQMDAFVRFILADKRLVRALKNLDWATFARIYNGPAYAKNRYDTKMASAYTRFGGV